MATNEQIRKGAALYIGELARRTGASHRSLRYYEKCGLLDSKRGDKGWREYDEIAVIQVTNIKDMLASGLRTKDIQRLPSNWLRQRSAEASTCEEVAATYARRLAELDADISELSACRERLVRRLSELPAIEVPVWLRSTHARTASRV